MDPDNGLDENKTAGNYDIDPSYQSAGEKSDLNFTYSAAKPIRTYRHSRWPRLDRKIYRDLRKLRIDPKQIALAGKGSIRDLLGDTAIYDNIERTKISFIFSLNGGDHLEQAKVETLHVSGTGTYLFGREGTFDLYVLYGKLTNVHQGNHLSVYVQEDAPVNLENLDSFVNYQLSKLEEYLRNGREIHDDCISTYREITWNLE